MPKPRMTTRAINEEGAEKITREGMPGYEVFFYTRNGTPYAYAYRGRRLKADYHNSYRNEEDRQKHADRWFAAFQDRAKHETARKELQAQPNPIKEGQIFVYSWGFEQTQVDFFQVVGVKGKSVVIRPIGYETVDHIPSQSMADYVVARKDKFISGATQTKRLQYHSDGRPYLSMDHSIANLWDGRKQYRSWYG